jgi:hypothetical protein
MKKKVRKVGEKIRQRWLLLFLAVTVFGCASNQSNREDIVTQPTAETGQSTSVSSNNIQICPTPPLAYESIPGYQPGKVDPSLVQETVKIISPVSVEASSNFYESILQQPIKFCGTAKENIVKVKLFSSGAYLYEKKLPEPSEPELPIGESNVENGLWFIAYDFRDGEGRRTIVAKGYDANDELVETSAPISMTLAGPNPG